MFGVNDDGLRSVPSPFEKYKRRGVAVSLFIGVVFMVAALYAFITEGYFLHSASAFDSTILEVRHEYVPKGVGSALAYVPIVEIASASQRVRLRVDTFSEEETYNIGSKMDVLCDLSSQRCIRNSFFDKWRKSLFDFIISFVFLLIPGLSWRRSFKRQIVSP